MARVFIGVGHGGKDPGAVSGNLIERDVNLTMALECKRVLEKHGVTVGISRTDNTAQDTVQQEIQEANDFGADIAIEIHNNAGGGDGSEFYFYGADTDGKRLAELLKKHTQAIGQQCRKVTSGNQFAWIRGTRMTAVLCEGFFLDNATDRQIADTEEKQKAFGRAYAKAVLEYLGVTYKQEQQAGSTKTYRVQVGAYKNRDNAIEMLRKLEEKGFKGFIRED